MDYYYYTLPGAKDAILCAVNGRNELFLNVNSVCSAFNAQPSVVMASLSRPLVMDGKDGPFAHYDDIKFVVDRKFGAYIPKPTLFELQGADH